LEFFGQVSPLGARDDTSDGMIVTPALSSGVPVTRRAWWEPPVDPTPPPPPASLGSSSSSGAPAKTATASVAPVRARSRSPPRRVTTARAVPTPVKRAAVPVEDDDDAGDMGFSLFD
jgi:hypothetical protein